MYFTRFYQAFRFGILLQCDEVFGESPSGKGYQNVNMCRLSPALKNICKLIAREKSNICHTALLTLHLKNYRKQLKRGRLQTYLEI